MANYSPICHFFLSFFARCREAAAAPAASPAASSIRTEPVACLFPWFAELLAVLHLRRERFPPLSRHYGRGILQRKRGVGRNRRQLGEDELVAAK